MALSAAQVPDKRVPWYIKDEDLPPLPEDIKDFFTRYSKIPASEVQAHVLRIRDQAWHIFPFPCIGQSRFLDFPISKQPSYASALPSLLNSSHSTSLSPSDKLIDVGTGLSADLRLLASAGVPSSHLAGIDIRADFFDVGYELFRDWETFQPTLVAADVLTLAPASISSTQAVAEKERNEQLPPPPVLQALVGTATFVHAASFLHMFGRADQLRACGALARLLRVTTGVEAKEGESGTGTVFGRFVGSPEPGEYPHATNPGGVVYAHDEETFRALWDEAMGFVGGEWRAEAWFVDEEGRRIGKGETMRGGTWKGAKFRVMHFEAMRMG